MRMLLGAKMFTALAGNEIMNDKQKSGKIDEAESKVTTELDAYKAKLVCLHYSRFHTPFVLQKKRAPVAPSKDVTSQSKVEKVPAEMGAVEEIDEWRMLDEFKLLPKVPSTLRGLFLDS